MNKKHQFNLSYFLLVLLVIIGLQAWIAARSIEIIGYSEFQYLLV